MVSKTKMRKRIVPESALNKTLFFLQDLYAKCDGKLHLNISYSELHSINHVSKSTLNACKQLGIIELKDRDYLWKGNDPCRQMALEVLEQLRVKQQKNIDPPALPNFEAIMRTVETLLTQIRDNMVIQQRGGKGLKTAETKGELFTDQEIREQRRFEIFKSVAPTIFSGMKLNPFELEKAINTASKMAILVTDDLLNEYYK
jgi:hypothetical protein